MVYPSSNSIPLGEITPPHDEPLETPVGDGSNDILRLAVTGDVYQVAGFAERLYPDLAYDVHQIAVPHSGQTPETLPLRS